MRCAPTDRPNPSPPFPTPDSVLGAGKTEGRVPVNLHYHVCFISSYLDTKATLKRATVPVFPPSLKAAQRASHKHKETLIV